MTFLLQFKIYCSQGNSLQFHSERFSCPMAIFFKFPESQTPRLALPPTSHIMYDWRLNFSNVSPLLCSNKCKVSQDPFACVKFLCKFAIVGLVYFPQAITLLFSLYDMQMQMQCGLLFMRRGGTRCYQCWKSMPNLFTCDNYGTTQFEFDFQTCLNLWF